MQSGSPSSPGGSNHPIDLEHWVMRTRPQYLSVSGTQVGIPAASQQALTVSELIHKGKKDSLTKYELEDCQVPCT